MRFLFGLEFTQAEWQPALDVFWEMQPTRPTVRRYAENVIRGICERRAALDAAIGGALQNWRLERIGRIELAVLLVAAYEMRYGEDIPAAVAIDEAIEIAKKYGPDEAPRFVNGVLDRLKNGLGETNGNP